MNDMGAGLAHNWANYGIPKHRKLSKTDTLTGGFNPSPQSCQNNPKYPKYDCKNPIWNDQQTQLGKNIKSYEKNIKEPLENNKKKQVKQC